MTYEDVKEMFLVLDLIAVEFKTDLRSVQCFDLRTVERAKVITDKLRPVFRQRKHDEYGKGQWVPNAD